MALRNSWRKGIRHTRRLWICCKWTTIQSKAAATCGTAISRLSCSCVAPRITMYSQLEVLVSRPHPKRVDLLSFLFILGTSYQMLIVSNLKVSMRHHVCLWRTARKSKINFCLLSSKNIPLIPRPNVHGPLLTGVRMNISIKTIIVFCIVPADETGGTCQCHLMTLHLVTVTAHTVDVNAGGTPKT